MQHSRIFYRPNTPRSNKLRHCDLYVVRLLPTGRRIQGTSIPDPARFGNSKPCLRCLHALAAVGVHRVIFTSGSSVEALSPAEQAEAIPYEVHSIRDLFSETTGHSSRGDVHQAGARGQSVAGPSDSGSSIPGGPSAMHQRAPRGGKSHIN